MSLACLRSDFSQLMITPRSLQRLRRNSKWSSWQGTVSVMISQLLRYRRRWIPCLWAHSDTRENTGEDPRSCVKGEARCLELVNSAQQSDPKVWPRNQVNENLEIRVLEVNEEHHVLLPDWPQDGCDRLHLEGNMNDNDCKPTYLSSVSILPLLSELEISDSSTLDLGAQSPQEHLFPAFCPLLPEMLEHLQTLSSRKGTLLAPEIQVGNDGMEWGSWSEEPSPSSFPPRGSTMRANVALHFPPATKEAKMSQEFFPLPCLLGIWEEGLDESSFLPDKAPVDWLPSDSACQRKPCGVNSEVEPLICWWSVMVSPQKTPPSECAIMQSMTRLHSSPCDEVRWEKLKNTKDSSIPKPHLCIIQKIGLNIVQHAISAQCWSTAWKKCELASFASMSQQQRSDNT